ncbi:endonuclease 8-like 3 [Babylonia areolata]|uniref:endonuclease 8-like 3 n=1 Tax=Babylonia areolata TaxID=304850 RepID=UPI003FCF49ED
MVEGPGCKLKGEKIRSKLLNQSVKAVSGNAVDREQKSLRKKRKGDDAKSDDAKVVEQHVTSFHQSIGQKLDEVLTLGKELFMFFGDVCLRVHFLMAGSFRVNDVQVDTDGGKKIPASASLEIQFSKDKLTFYKCAAEIRPPSACHQKYKNLKDLDICSPTFNPKLAVKEMMLEKDRQLCDVLLDQDVLPGVGNIIKNEALFDSGLKPDSKVSELCVEHISHLVKMTRDFSMLFYKCRKNGTNLRQYMKVYQKGKCGECSTKITMTRMGEDSERVTYFCPTCQTNDMNKRGPLKLPSKNSLLGWVQTDQNNSATEEWTCHICTLLNPANQNNCSACLSSRNSQSASFSHTVLGQSDLSSPAVTAGPAKRKLQDSSLSSPGFSHHKKLKTEAETEVFSPGRLRKDGQSPSSVQQAEADSSDDSKIPVCTGHKLTCAMRQTFKDNGNKGRWFFTCAVSPASKQCKFFQWADGQFPLCSGHGKVCALRTVMKQGPNNGCRFFCCPVRRNGCQFFEWASGYS